MQAAVSLNMRAGIFACSLYSFELCFLPARNDVPFLFYNYYLPAHLHFCFLPFSYVVLYLYKLQQCSLPAKQRLNMEVNLQSFFWAVQLHSLAETPQLPPSPRIWAHIRGRYWSSKIDDISLCNPPAAKPRLPIVTP